MSMWNWNAHPSATAGEDSAADGPTSWTSGSGLESPKFTDKSTVIAVMGMTGSGKTTFIRKISGFENMKIGHGLTSSTKKIQIISLKRDDLHYIDTPGFDDTELKDTDILIEIATYLAGRGVRLSGLLYLHPIDTRRMGGAAARNLKMFQKLVGEKNMHNVKLVTTMWDCVAPETGKARLDELERDFWSEMIGAGAQVDRCDDAAEDGKRIIHSILKTSLTLQVQKEMRDEKLSLSRTAAGKVVMDQLNDMREKHERDIKKLSEQMSKATGDMEAALRRSYEENLRQQAEAAEQERRLLKAEIKILQQKVEKLEKGPCIIL